ncbi:ATP-binding protein [Thermopolyspora sp. NPDC052614]|uniref:ATP-binding protein n=1 Tax=Thermopolyspora sp. NPDC052614 TaxID=3155682 RepID=UPI003441E360
MSVREAAGGAARWSGPSPELQECAHPPVGSPSSAAIARNRLARLLKEWGHGDLTETAQLVLTELMTNAAKATVGFYALTGVDSGDEHALLHEMLTASDESIEVDVYRSSDAIGLAVWDRLRTPPRLREADEGDVGGRGLTLINELAAS